MRGCRRIVGAMTAFAIAVASGSVLAQTPAAPKEVGPSVGQVIPAFRARDQFGREQTLSSLAGPRGLVLLFVRSADW